MTFCLAMRCHNGLVALSDTRLTSGDMDFIVTGKKIYLYQDDAQHTFFAMFSGLKSVTDEIVTYLNEKKEQLYSFERLHQAVDIVCQTARSVREREEPWLAKENYPFDLNIIVGGQFPADQKCQLFRIYPEGSWKKVVRDTPYEIIGESKYGKPILDMALTVDTAVAKAFLLGLIAFDFTRKSTPLVYPPLDVLTYELDSFNFKLKRYEDKDLFDFSRKWEQQFKKIIDKMMEVGQTSL